MSRSVSIMITHKALYDKIEQKMSHKTRNKECFQTLELSKVSTLGKKKKKRLNFLMAKANKKTLNYIIMIF